MKTFMAAAALLAALFSSSGALAQDGSDLKWQAGPAKGAIDDRATVDIPDGYVFLDNEETTAAYRRRIAEYHPDKVARMGEEIRALAGRRTREINAAYDDAMRGRPR